MSPSWIYRFLADVVLAAHFAIVLFVIGGLLLIILGNRFGWSVVNRFWFRMAHVASIAVIVAESWFGITCPLTSLEAWLRTTAGYPSYTKSFVEYWVQRLLFFEAPSWVFALAYSAFGLLVVTTWWLFPPKFSRTRKERSA